MSDRARRLDPPLLTEGPLSGSVFVVTLARRRHPMPDPTLGHTEATVSIPAGTRFTVYWCPRCKIQSSKSWHFCEKGHPMFRQTDVETQCVRAVVEFEGEA